MEPVTHHIVGDQSRSDDVLTRPRRRRHLVELIQQLHRPLVVIGHFIAQVLPQPTGDDLKRKNTVLVLNR